VAGIFILNFLKRVVKASQAHIPEYRTRPPQLGQDGTYRIGPRGISAERERVETCRNQTKRFCSS